MSISESSVDVEPWIIYFCFFALPDSSRQSRLFATGGHRGVSFLMTAFILRAGIRSMRATLTCRATLIANRFIGRTILLEFNTILCVHRQTMPFDPTSYRSTYPCIINALFSHVNPPTLSFYYRRLCKFLVKRRFYTINFSQGLNVLWKNCVLSIFQSDFNLFQ